MTTFLLVRHGDTGAIGKCLAGWIPGWHLNNRGKDQVCLLAQKLSELPVKAVYTSPLERAMETAAALAAPHGLVARIRDRLGGWIELDHRGITTCTNRYRRYGCPAGG